MRFARATGGGEVGSPSPTSNPIGTIMKFSDRYNYDKIAAEEGRWVPLDAGVKVKLRAFDSEHTRALRNKLQAPHNHLIKRGKDLPEDVQNEINVKLIAGSSLVDWDIGNDDNDEKIAFSPGRAEQILNEEPMFLRDIIAALMAADTFKKQAREEATKNS